MKQIRLLFIFYIGIFAPCVLFAESTKRQVCLNQNCVNFSLSDKWVLAEKDADGASYKVDHFKLFSLRDELGRKIIPSISFIFRDYPQVLDPILFNINSRSQSQAIKFVDSFFLQKISESEEIYKFMGYKGNFKHNEDTILQHFITATDKKTGIILVVTCYENVYGQIEPDISDFLNSLRFEARQNYPRFKNQKAKQDKAMELERNGLKLIQTKNTKNIQLGLEMYAEGCDLGYKKLCIMYNTLTEIKAR